MSARLLKPERFKRRVERLIHQCLAEWESEVARTPDCRLRLFYKLPGLRNRIGDVKLSAHASNVWVLGSYVEFHGAMKKAHVHRLIAILILDMPILRGPIEGLPIDEDIDALPFVSR